jgi:MoaA/NifB/PqqE/SkfB family radical SAM enzyme
MILLRPGNYLRDVFRFIQCFRGRHLRNAFRLRCSFYYSRISRKYFHRGLPLALAIETYAGCTLRCPECPAGQKTMGMSSGPMQMGLYQKVLEESGDGLFYVAFHFLGEPTLHPSFWDMVRMAADQACYTELHTHGQLLPDIPPQRILESGLHRLRISVDGASQDTYEIYRQGGSLEKIISATKMISAARKAAGGRGPLILWQCILFRHNAHERKALHQLAKASGADALEFKTAWVKEADEVHPLLPPAKKDNRYTGKERKKYCWKVWHSCVVDRDGRVLPCCFDKDRAYPLGNAATQPLREIWRSESAHRLRAAAYRKKHPLCGG